MVKKFDFDYDFDNDSLFLYSSRSKSKASVEFGDLIIDYDSKKQISGFELLNASKFFKGIVSKDVVVSKSKLRDISGCKVDVIKKNNFLIIKFIFTLKSKEVLSAPILIPFINEKSPAVMA
jgi:uncharacterized protein YuzE